MACQLPLDTQAKIDSYKILSRQVWAPHRLPHLLGWKEWALQSATTLSKLKMSTWPQNEIHISWNCVRRPCKIYILEALPAWGGFFVRNNVWTGFVGEETLYKYQDLPPRMYSHVQLTSSVTGFNRCETSLGLRVPSSAVRILRPLWEKCDWWFCSFINQIDKAISFPISLRWLLVSYLLWKWETTTFCVIRHQLTERQNASLIWFMRCWDVSVQIFGAGSYIKIPQPFNFFPPFVSCFAQFFWKCDSGVF